MAGNVTGLINSKILLLIFTALLILGGAYTVQQHSTQIEQPKDAYVDTIQKNAEYINGVVVELAKGQGANEQHIAYWQKCENILDTIRGQNLEAEQGYPTVSANHKDINVKYRAFLHEAANAVIIGENGGKPNLTKMNAAKAALY